MVNVVAALIVKNNKILIAKRKEGHHKGMWEFPGGKIEENETEEIALKREIKEELNVEIEIKKYISQTKCIYPHISINIKLYEAYIKSGNIKLIDHDEYLFVKKEDLLNYNLTKADKDLILMKK